MFKYFQYFYSDTKEYNPPLVETSCQVKGLPVDNENTDLFCPVDIINQIASHLLHHLVLSRRKQIICELYYYFDFPV